MVIAIERQRGSYGSEIAQKLAEKLGCECYDRKLVAMAAERSGMSEKVFESFDERPTNSLLYSLVLGTYTMDNKYVNLGDVSVPLSDKLYQLQTDIIKELASQGDCVFVGRCAASVLSECSDLVSVFISDDYEKRLKRVMEVEQLNEKKAADLIAKTDKRRANYYNFNTSMSWSSAESYDLCIRTSSLGVDSTVDYILSFAKSKIG